MNNDQKDKVSIIIPTYNGSKTIQETLESILFQTYKNYEIVIVDDDSTDSTLEIVRKIAPSAKIIQQKNQGTMAARQLGINISNGEFIALLDQDDIWFNIHLFDAISYLNSHPSTGMFVANMAAIDEKGNKLNFDVVPNPEKYFLAFENLLLIQPIATSTAVFRRTLIEKVGGLNTFYGFSGAMGDLDFFIRASEVTPLYFKNKNLGLYRWSETRPGRLISFLDNLQVYAKTFWNHPRLIGNLKKDFALACAGYSLHIFRLLLKQYNYNVDKELLSKITQHNDTMEAVFGDLYKTYIDIKTIDISIFDVEKKNHRSVPFLYLTKKDIQEFFPKIANSYLDNFIEWVCSNAAKWDAQLAERDAQLAERDAQLAGKDAQLAGRDAQLAERDAQLAERNAQLAERDAQLAERDAQLIRQNAHINAMYGSTSWRVTSPLRELANMLRKIKNPSER